MASTPDTWIANYLDTHQAYSNAIPLEGGVSNYLYRLTRASDGSTVILKRAEPYAASNKTWSYGIERMSCEHAALFSIPAALRAPSSSNADFADGVQVPTALSYDAEGHVLIMSDFGADSMDLHTAFPTLSPSQRVDHGRRLGLWLAALHTCATLDKAAFSKNVASKDMARKAMAQRIELLGTVLPAPNPERRTDEQSTQDQTWLRNLVQPYVDAAAEHDTICVVHGDFWPGNILVSVRRRTTSSLTELTEPADDDLLAVIDWECTRLGSGASDVGVFAAEAWLLCHFHRFSARASFVEGTEVEDFGMLDAFLVAYAEAGRDRGQSIDERFLQKMLVHFAINLAVGRGTREQMAPVKRLGVEVVRLAVERDWAGIVQLGPRMGAFGPWLAQIDVAARRG